MACGWLDNWSPYEFFYSNLSKITHGRTVYHELRSDDVRNREMNTSSRYKLNVASKGDTRLRIKGCHDGRAWIVHQQMSTARPIPLCWTIGVGASQ
eukprot:scaffold374990_cov18-Prasinocladus_malaysianus.AAC.1